MMRRHASLFGLRSPQAGVSIVEALVAMAVMAFGMLALVGVQATLRLNADVARQRSEATRIAEEDIERLRAFNSVDAASALGGLSWDTIVSAGAAPVAVDRSNTTFMLTRSVFIPDGSAQRILSVQVNWVDRVGTTQTIVMRSVIAGVSPALGGLLSVQPTAMPGHMRSGRHPTIPVRAHDYDSGKSAFKPIEGGTVAWTFDNLTGVITNVCAVTTTTRSSTITTADLGSCTATTAQLLAGEVRFNLRGAENVVGAISIIKPEAGGTVAWVIDNGSGNIIRSCKVPAASSSATLTVADVSATCTAATQPVSPFSVLDSTVTLAAGDSEFPAWPALCGDIALALSSSGHSSSPLCFNNAPTLSSDGLGQASVEYFCIIFPNSTNVWGGRSTLVPAAYSDNSGSAWTIGGSLGQYKICRYTQASTDFTDNADHPKDYCSVKSASCTSLVTGNLVNQNFLVISGNKSCPTDSAISAASGNLVDSNTLLHQP